MQLLGFRKPRKLSFNLLTWYRNLRNGTIRYIIFLNGISISKLNINPT